MGEPTVSVITPVFNALHYLPQAMDSVLRQTIGLERMEILLINDGSTDGSDQLLEAYARRYPQAVRVFHHDTPSGGPGRPRNTGLDRARGAYVFFLDADDWIGDEALERMVKAAEEWGSDILLGKMVSVSGYPAPQSMFRVNQPKADLFTSSVYWTLSASKLFRRDLIERLRLRFAHHFGEDEPFTTHAYLHAETISVIADYECIYLRMREDGGNMVAGSVDYVAGVQRTKSLMELITRHVLPGSGREFMIYRNVCRGYLRFFDAYWLRLDDAERRKVAEAVRDDLPEWLTPGVWGRLDPVFKLRAHCALNGRLDELAEIVRASDEPMKVIARGDRFFQALPYFGELPDDCYDYTHKAPVQSRLDAVEWQGDALELRGEAWIDGLDAAAEIEMLLVERRSKKQVRLRADGNFAVRIAPEPGVWDLSAVVRVGQAERAGRIGANRDVSQTVGEPRFVDATLVQPYYTVPWGNLTLDVGGRVFPLGKAVRLTRVAWHEQAIEVSGEVSFGRQGNPANAAPALVWHRRGGSAEVRGELGRPVILPGAGVWDAYAEFTIGGTVARARIGATRAAGISLEPRRWREGRRWWAARPYNTVHGNLSVTIKPLWRAMAGRARGALRVQMLRSRVGRRLSPWLRSLLRRG